MLASKPGFFTYTHTRFVYRYEVLNGRSDMMYYVQYVLLCRIVLYMVHAVLSH